MKKHRDQLARLKEILDNLDHRDIYRSVYDAEGNLLAKGLEPLHERLRDDFKLVDFRDKTVIDLGCNLGLFSFLAAEQGAKHVTGVDFMPEIVEGAELLADLKQAGNVSFATFNFEQPDRDLGRFDTVMLVDFFGRSNIRKRKVAPIIGFMQSIAKKEMVFAIRTLNRIERDLKISMEDFSKLYPARYISDGIFHLLDFIRDLLGEEWDIHPVSPYDGRYYKFKILFLCRKRV